ncbi:MAG: 6-phosphofructokinase [Rickettsiales bacterium]|nr:6-phosphofructokinase [Rickettsiales bacterium]
MNNLLITMSGGTTTVINATLVGIIKEARKNAKIEKIYAGYPGISGVLNENIVDLTKIRETELNKLYYTPSSAFIGTTRVKPLNFDELKNLSDVCNIHNIKYFLNIGGNGTIKQTINISKALPKVKCVALPKTVDNDLGDLEFKDVLYTPGFPSCANYWKFIIKIMNQENLGACSHDKVLVTQTFGRETGFLAGCARLADKNRKLPLLILIPEDQRKIEDILEKIKYKLKKVGRLMIIMTEGYKIGDIGKQFDHTGQIMYGSSQTTSAQTMVNKCMENNIQARCFIPSIDQRSNFLYTTKEDLFHAENIGIFAIQKLIEGYTNFFASICYTDLGYIGYKSIPFETIQNFSRKMPNKWIDFGNFDVTDLFVDYVESIIGTPLINNMKNIFDIDFAAQNYPLIKKLNIKNNIKCYEY